MTGVIHGETLFYFTIASGYEVYYWDVQCGGLCLTDKVQKQIRKVLRSTSSAIGIATGLIFLIKDEEAE